MPEEIGEQCGNGGRSTGAGGIGRPSDLDAPASSTATPMTATVAGKNRPTVGQAQAPTAMHARHGLTVARDVVRGPAGGSIDSARVSTSTPWSTPATRSA